MNGLDAPDPEVGGAESDHPENTTRLGQFLHWMASTGFADAGAAYRELQVEAEFDQRAQWIREAGDVHRYTESLPPLSGEDQRIGAEATEILGDMNRLEFEGKVLWNQSRRTWEKPHRVATAHSSYQPLSEAQLLARFDRVSLVRDGWKARCPSHEDRSPSLSIRRGRRWWLTHCFAGCTVEQVCAAVGLTVADLALKRGSNG